MTTFISYQPPPAAAPAVRRKALRPPSHCPPFLAPPHGFSHGLGAGVPFEQTSRLCESQTQKIRDGVEVVELPCASNSTLTQERQTAEDGLPGTEVTTSVANDDSRENTVDSMEEVGGGDHHGDDSDLPSLEDIFPRTRAMATTTIPHSERRMGHNGISKSGRLVGGRTDMQDRKPNIESPAGSRLGSSQECPIIVDDLDEDDDDGVCPSPDVNTAVTNPASPPAEAPAAAGHIHDIFAEYEIRFGSDSSTRKSGQRKGSSPSFLHGTKPGRDESLALSAQGEGSALVEHEPQDPDCTITSFPGNGGLDAGYATNTERDCDEPSSRIEDGCREQNEAPLSVPTAPNPLPRKRSCLPAQPQRPSRKRACGSSRRTALQARGEVEAEESSARFNSHDGLRRRQDKLWDVTDLGRVSVEDGGSLSCELLWAPTIVPVSSLKGALLERAEALVKRDHGAEAWEKWLEMQSNTGRCRGGRGNL